MKRLFMLVVLLGTASAFPASPSLVDDEIKYRLDETTVPVHYDLTITPYLEDDNGSGNDQFTFDGIVQIVLKPTETKETLRIHYKNLDITEILIEEQGTSNEISVNPDPVYVEEAEILELTFNRALSSDQSYILTFEYTGHMDNDMHGFYRSYYKENGEIVWMGSTQMQQTHARRVFPGFDEPSYKATFQLTVNKPKHYNVFSNTNPIGDPTEISETHDKVVFKKTPIMSSYLLAFVVSTFTRRTGETDPSFGILARDAQYAQSEYAYEFGKRALRTLGNYIDYDYYTMEDGDGDNLEKMDMAAIPDFSAGAMENWGLLTYRETNLLYDPDYTTDLTRQRIAAVIIHEQAHMWFGDLVTCEWWGDTWLNEGFARFFQYHATSIMEPLWEVDKQFVVEQVQTALLFDSSENTHPMSHDVNTPAEAAAIFNNISYNKGASVLRMIQHLIGNTKFVEAIRAYIKENQYEATVPQNLFDEFLAVAEDEYPNIVDIIKSWTTQANYPVITVSYDGNEATVTQRVFLLKPDTTNENLWQVPLTYATRRTGFSTTKPSTILDSESEKIPIVTDGSWLIFNVQQTGYYRVNYDEDNWQLIKTALLSENQDGIHELNRAQIIDDLFNLARTGDLTFEFVYEMYDYLKTEVHYIPWLSAFTTFNFIISKMSNEQLADFRQYIILLLDKSYYNVGWVQTTNDAQLTIYHRSNVINWLCKSGHNGCITEARRLFDDYKADDTKLVPVNIRAAVYCSAMRHGSIEDLDYLWSQYEAQEIATEQLTILTAIGCAKDKDVLSKAIDYILSSSVRDQDRRSALTNTYTQTEENLQLVLDYVMVKENRDKIQTGFGGDLGAVVTTLTLLASRFTTYDQVDQLQTFWDENQDDYIDYETRLTSAISSAKAQIVWNNEYIPKIIAQIKTNIGATNEEVQYRLEETTFPIHYDLTIRPYLEKDNEFGKDQFTFDGTVHIEILPTKTKKILRIHVNNLEIASQSIVRKGSIDEIAITNSQYNEEFEILELTFAEYLIKEQTYILTFVYTGYINENMRGFYRSSYTEDDQTVWMGTTQLQSRDARRVFPSFDEPLYKATFQLTMEKPKSYSAYSNTNPINEVAPGISESYDQVRFKKTPKMSSYLVAFIVSTFTERADPTFGVIAREAQKDQSEYAYDFGKHSLGILGEYIDYGYYTMVDGDGNNLEKMNMAAIPDFSAGAMENWGLLTYREANLLFDPDYTSDLARQRIATVIIHEQAHMWFGNLVTCAWWGDTWLNEGFARFFEYYGTAITEPLWEVDKQFVVDQVQTALLFDSSETTHPMSDIINRPGASMSSTISYNKAASVIRMVQHLIGDTKFVEAIRAYIKKYEYKATVPQNIFDEFLAVAEDEYPNLLDIITPWTTQANYPVITVSYDANAKEAAVTQKVFLLKPDTTNTKTWHVPLTYATKTTGFDETKPSTILTSLSDKIQIDTDGSWLIFNVQQTGYYRVNYDEDNWQLIKTALLSENHDDIHELNRAQIVDDLFNLARTGDLTFEFVFEMYHYLKTEEHYLPWRSAFTSLNFLTSRMNTEQLAVLKQYAILLLNKSYSSVGWEQTENDAQLAIYHRTNVINWLCKSGHNECINEARKLFDAYKADDTKLVPVNIRAAVYCSAMRHGSIEDLDYLWSKYEAQEIATEQLTILTAIGCANDMEVLSKAIDNILSSSVRDQDRRSALTNTFTQTEENVQLVLDYVMERENRDKIQAGFGGDLGAVVTTLEGLASRFATDAQLEQLEQFLDGNRVEYASYVSRLTSAINSAKTQIEWNSEYIPKVIAQINVNTQSDVGDGPGTGIAQTASLLVVAILSLGAYFLNY